MWQRTFLTGIAVLFLATGTAHAESPDTRWTASFHSCTINKTFAFHSKTVVDSTLYGENGEVHADNGSATVSLRLEDVLAIQNELKVLKKCEAFYQCVVDREAGKVKHCYEKDKRWR